MDNQKKSLKRPVWDCITKDLWKSAYQIMRLHRPKNYLDSIKSDRLAFEHLKLFCQDYSARVFGIFAEYYFKYFRIRIND